MIEKLLRKFLPHKELGWTEIGEKFTRYTLLKLPNWLGGFRVFLHQLDCEQWHDKCHDHPWSFITFILKGGYDESTTDGKTVYRRPGSILYRPATFAHNVKTCGKTCWSIVVTTRKVRDWSMFACVE